MFRLDSILGSGRRRAQAVASLAAVRRKGASGAVDALESIAASPAEVPAKAREIFSAEELAAFRRAGWIFEERKAAPEVFHEVEEEEGFQVVVTEGNHGAIVQKTLTIKLNPAMTEDNVEEFFLRNHLTLVNKLRFAPNLFEVSVSVTEASVIYEKAAELEAKKGVIYAEPNLTEYIPTRSALIEPEEGPQWHLLAGAEGGVDAEAALFASRDLRKGVRVAIIDNGFDPTHKDFEGRVDPESGHFEGGGQGASAKFVRGFNGLQAGPDQIQHGTFCSGMLGAHSASRNGVAPDATILLLACLLDQVGDQVTLARAIAYAADPSVEGGEAADVQGADVISCSLGRTDGDWKVQKVLIDAINFAAKGREGRGIPIFWAVQNNYLSLQRDGVCALPQVTAVGACNKTGRKSAPMAFGKKLEFLAPGVDVFGTIPATAQGLATGKATGTSYAAPCAAGIAALLLSVDPDLSRDELITILRSTCEKIGREDGPYILGRNSKYGFGRVNAAAAMSKLLERTRREPSLGGPINSILNFLGRRLHLG